MSTIAIIGAGPGLGAAVARRFGREGFSVALIARTQDHLDRLAAQLGEADVTARGYAADVRDPRALRDALKTAEADLGPIEVLQYSPVPQKDFLKPVLETSVEDLAAATQFSILGPAAAIEQALPGMRERGQGTVLFVNGSSATMPNGRVAGTSTAFAGESAYAKMLHEALAPEGVHVGQLIIPGAIGGGDPLYAPEALADRLWGIHLQSGNFRTVIGEEAASSDGP